MMTPLRWAKTTQAPWSRNLRRSPLPLSVTACALALFLIAVPAIPSVPLPQSDPALTLLRLASTELEQKRYPQAVRHLREAQAKLPKIADYLAYSLASAQFELRDFPAVIRELQPVWNSSIPSPLVPNAALLAARAHLQNGAPAEAVRVLRQYYAQLPQPAGDALLASACEAADDPPSAAVYHQQVYYQYPATAEAEQSAAALARLKDALGSAYPSPMPQAMFQRAEKWIRAGDFRRARAEYESIVPRVAGLDRELARLRIPVTDYLASRTASACVYLKSLELSSPEADAERLYYLAECARRLDRDEERLQTLDRLAELHPQSPWRLKALVSAANHYLIENRPEVFERLYGLCFESFPSDPQAGYCHWRVAWSAYIHRRPEAAEMLREHLLKYPGSEKADVALYFLGRLSESGKNLAAAKAYYEEAVDRFPNHHYATLAQQRLSQPQLFRVVPSPEVTSFLKGLVWPLRRYPESFDPTPLTRLRLERSRLLSWAGLESLSDGELRFGAKTDAQPHLLGMELAQAAAKRGASFQGIRILKSLVPNYLWFPLDSAPTSFWRLLFPLPYRAELERYAKQRGFDLFLLAGLVRQESEFNPQAVSSARAYGLTQILPSTGRLLARKLGPSRFRTAMLLRADINLRLGTAYLRSLFDQHAAQWEPTLAAFNAGATRVQNWLTWASYQEPAEFVETIPFSETRNYVLAVLRNAQIYRRLYAAEKLPLLASPASKKPAPKKAGPFKRAPVVR